MLLKFCGFRRTNAAIAKTENTRTLMPHTFDPSDDVGLHTGESEVCASAYGHGKPVTPSRIIIGNIIITGHNRQWTRRERVRAEHVTKVGAKGDSGIKFL